MQVMKVVMEFYGRNIVPPSPRQHFVPATFCPTFSHYAHIRDMPKMCPRYARDMPKICPRYAQDLTTRKMVLTKRLPDKRSKLVLTKCLPDKTSADLKRQMDLNNTKTNSYCRQCCSPPEK